MDRILGIAGIAIILIAVGFAAGLMLNDGGDDRGDGGDASETDRTIEYRLTLREYPDGYGFTVKFIGTVAGGLEMYLGDEPLLDGHQEPITRSWSVGERVDFSYSLDYPEGKDFAYIENNLRVVFSPNIDAVQVD